MKKLIQLNLLLSFRWKTFLIISIYLLLLAVTRAYLLHHDANIGSIHINIWDLLIQSQGGLKVDPEDFKMWEYAGWVSSVIPILFFTYQVAGLTTGYDTFLLTRSGSRCLWWVAKLISIMILSILYGTWLLLVHGTVGICFFPVEEDWSTYFTMAFPGLAQLHIGPGLTILMIWSVFVSGLIAISFAVLVMALFFINSTHAYIMATILHFSGGAFYLNGLITKKWAIFFYPSLLDSLQLDNPDLFVVTNLLLLHLFCSLLCVMVNLIQIRKWNISLVE